MEQHPVPQHIASYEFHLIGDMTLKQFAELSAGAILALICWTIPIPIIFKYPLVGFFGFLGLSLAFMPINERPLDHWIISFFKAVYSPTQFIWQKAAFIPDLWQTRAFPRLAKPEKLIPKGKKTLQEYLTTIPSKRPLPPLDQIEEKSLQRIDTLFNSLDIAMPSPTPKLTPSPASIFTAKPPFPFAGLKIDQAEKKEPQKKELKIPQTKSIKISAPAPAPSAAASPNLQTPTILKLPKFKRAPYKTVAATFEPKLPMPTRPTKANILVGMVLTKSRKILPDVIIEIRDKDGFPVRALRANKLGQFSIATPLKNGSYEVEMEKKGYQFDIIRFAAKGKIIEPMEIRAKN